VRYYGANAPFPALERLRHNTGRLVRAELRLQPIRLRSFASASGGIGKAQENPEEFPCSIRARPPQARCHDGIGEQKLEPIPSNGTDRSQREKRPAEGKRSRSWVWLGRRQTTVPSPLSAGVA